MDQNLKKKKRYDFSHQKLHVKMKVHHSSSGLEPRLYFSSQLRFYTPSFNMLSLYMSVFEWFLNSIVTTLQYFAIFWLHVTPFGRIAQEYYLPGALFISLPALVVLALPWPTKLIKVESFFTTIVRKIFFLRIPSTRIRFIWLLMLLNTFLLALFSLQEDFFEEHMEWRRQLPRAPCYVRKMWWEAFSLNIVFVGLHGLANSLKKKEEFYKKAKGM
mgnify:CR=1 FL=1